MTFYATTPIYYVNDKPHIGHAYCTILADVCTRYQKVFGENAYFLTGTDEHGQKVSDTAKARGISAQQHVDEYHLHFKNLWPSMNIKNDDFIRTTETRHTETVKAILTKLHDNGDIYQKEYEGWYSVSAEKYWTEKDLVDGKCPDTGTEVVRLKEKNYFFKMSKYKEALVDHINKNPEMIFPEYRKNEVLGFLEKPLNDLCISRPKSRLDWGIELPFDKDFVTYVWFDALVNYISAIGYGNDEANFDLRWSGAHHFLGKDILTTHCVYWTTMLFALKLPLPKRFIVTGWWLMGGDKMSKSTGNVVNPLDLMEQYGVDVLRYFLIREMSIGQDSAFTEELFLNRNNSELANDFGNLIRRTMALIARNFDNKLPAPGNFSDDDKPVLEKAEALFSLVKADVESFKLKAALEKINEFVRALNRYMTQTEPFKLVKSDPERAGTILYLVLDGVRLVTQLLEPVMPEKCAEILEHFELEEADNIFSSKLKPGMAIPNLGKLFPRFELKKAESEQTKAPKKQKKAKEEKEIEGDFISIDDFFKVELKAGKVLKCEKMEKSDKLLKLEIDLGEEEPRQILSGIAKYYAPEDLVGKIVSVVANLKPRKMMGMMSQGMVLAGSDENGLAVAELVKDIKPGTRIS